MSTTTNGPKPINIRVTESTRGNLDHLAKVYPLSRHAIANRALELGLKVLVNQHGWLAEGGDGKTNSYVPRDESNQNEHTYLIHHNGGRPWWVGVTPASMMVLKYTKWDGPRTAYDEVIHRETSYRGHWRGFDTSGCFAHGNTVLVELDLCKYLFIGGDIFEFETEDLITEYVSPLGNSNVPYPVAFSNKNVYFLLDKSVVERRDLDIRASVWNAEKLYTEFYWHDGFKAPKRVPMKITRKIASVVP